MLIRLLFPIVVLGLLRPYMAYADNLSGTVLAPDQTPITGCIVNLEKSGLRDTTLNGEFKVSVPATNLIVEGRLPAKARRPLSAPFFPEDGYSVPTFLRESGNDLEFFNPSGRRVEGIPFNLKRGSAAALAKGATTALEGAIDTLVIRCSGFAPKKMPVPQYQANLGNIVLANPDNTEKVANTFGLVAFWDFQRIEKGTWTSAFDPQVMDRGLPVYLKRIGDSLPYNLQQWPYQDTASKVVYDSTGPFGKAVRFNQGYVYGEIPRRMLDSTPLAISGRRPFTMISWVKFIGERHMVSGIWDEGGWGKYGGRRQYALFAGLFSQKGVIAHISETGAASYPQSNLSGAQYARARAIDGAAFENQEWVAMAMAYNPVSQEVVAYLNGTATPKNLTDPIAQDVFQYTQPVACNPFRFEWPLYAPKVFVIKYNGYTVAGSGMYEHWLTVDATARTVVYGRSFPANQSITEKFSLSVDVQRNGKSLFPQTLEFDAVAGSSVNLPSGSAIQVGDSIVTSLYVLNGNQKQRVGTEVSRGLQEGAPFTFGRALGLGGEELTHGSQLYIAGVAVFNRVLTAKELKELGFH